MALARDAGSTEGWEARSDRSVGSLGEIGREKLEGISERAGLSVAQRRAGLRLFDQLTHSWSARPAIAYPSWSSDITDDGTPFEFSLAFTGAEPKLRLLVESQAADISEHSTWHAALELNARLRREGLARLGRFEQIEDLFRPRPGVACHFSLWHASVLHGSGNALIKTYLNPAVHGASEAPELVRRAFARLGHESSWAFLEPRLRAEGSRVLYLSLDLDDGPDARLKVYVGRRDSCAGIERLIAGAANVEEGRASDWIEVLAGRTRDFHERPVLACFAFTRPGEAPRVTVHVPVRCYRENDADSVNAVSRFLNERDASVLRSVTEYLAHLPLALSRGVLTYASLRSAASGSTTDVTVYLAPQLYALGATR
jgi:hypothetical protein